jgi:hypothetical protein
VSSWSTRCAVAALAAATSAALADEPPRRYAVTKVGVAPSPRIDGRLDDVAWKSAPWSEPFVDIEGDLRPPPLFTTRFRALWDETHLYVAAELEEPHLYATLTRHDSVIFQDPDFELFLDPDGDTLHYFELELNAFGTTWDLKLDRPYHQSGRPDDGWELVGLRLGVGLDGTLNEPRDIDSGWTVELAMPWSAFQPPGGSGRAPAPGETWRVNFSRVQWALETDDGRYRKVPDLCESNWVWTPQGRIDMHRPERWGHFDFQP